MAMSEVSNSLIDFEKFHLALRDVNLLYCGSGFRFDG
jgi:hypothetical protein